MSKAKQTEEIMSKKNLTMQGMTPLNALLLVLGMAAVGLSIYLTKHFFESHFPTGIQGSGFCSISAFWNCDVATFSTFSNIAGIPISFFGMLFGCFIIAGSIFPSEKMERTNGILAAINAAGCLVLFLYSLIALKGLCPFCAVYYIVSWAIFYLFLKFGDFSFQISPKIIAIYLVPTIVGGAIFHLHFNSETEKLVLMSDSILKEFKTLKNYGNPETDSKFRIHTSAEKFSDAPIQLTVFSDFQCPACLAFEETIAPLIKKFSDKINVQYFPYPLDDHCNPNMKRSLHPHACHAARVSMCAPERFETSHTELFKAQSDLSESWLNDYAKKLGVTECAKGEAVKKLILAGIELGEKYERSSTPTIIINGKKIEGSLPAPYFTAIFNSLLGK